MMYALPSTNCLWIGALLYILSEKSVSLLFQDGASFSLRKSNWLIIRDRRRLTLEQIPVMKLFASEDAGVQCTVYSAIWRYPSFFHGKTL